MARTRRDSMRFLGSAGWIRGALLAALALAACALSAAPASATATVFTWSGASTSADWSDGTNWGGTAPSGSVGTLTFPNLPGCASPKTCFVSHNDVSGISASNLSIDNTGSYSIDGSGISLTSGLTVGSGPGTANLALPITLGGANTWSLSGPLDVTAQMPSTSNTLAVDLAADSGSVLGLTQDDELGTVTIAGADGAQTGVNAPTNGLVSLFGAGPKLNATSGHAVSLTDAALVGAGSVGALTSTGGELQPGNNGPVGNPGKLIFTGAVSLDGASAAEFTLKHATTTPGTDFGQVDAGSNSVALGDSTLLLALNHFTCPTLTAGSVYTLLTTTGTLSGAFGNAPDGTVLTTQPGCSKSAMLQIHYTAHTVTATVVTTPPSGGGGTPSGGGSPSVTPSNQTPVTGGGTPNGAITVSAAQLKALLLGGLVPHGKAAKIAALLKAGGYTLTFTAPEAGTAQVNWYYLPPGAHIARAHAKPVLVASGRISISAPGSAKLKLRLTKAGRRLLKHARKLKLTGRGSFTPSGGSAVVAKKTFSVKR